MSRAMNTADAVRSIRIRNVTVVGYLDSFGVDRRGIRLVTKLKVYKDVWYCQPPVFGSVPVP